MNAPPSLRWITKLINNGFKHRRRQTLRAGISGGRTYRPQLEVLEDRVTPSNFNVIDLSETAGSASDVTLRYAITNAANDDTVTFDQSIYGGTITLNSDLTINANITITGPGASEMAIDGGGVSQVFVIPSGVTASISGLTIQHGFGTNGGGVYNAGTLTLNDDVITNNVANGSGGVNAVYSGGGGIYNSGSLTFSNSVLSDNAANYSNGGAIYNAGTLSIEGSTLFANSAPSILPYNVTSYSNGGAIYNAGTLSIEGSTLFANSAQEDGGAIYTSGFTTTTITNSTLFSNSTGRRGGAIVTFSTLLLTNDTIADNCTTATSATSGGIFGDISSMDNTIVAGNTQDDTSVAADVRGTITTANYDLIGTSANGLAIASGTNNLLNISADLDAALADNGVATPTLALLPGSPALYAGDPRQAGTIAQNGVVRPADPSLGAYQALTVTPNTAVLPVNTTEMIINGTGFESVLVANDTVTFDNGITGTIVVATPSMLVVSLTGLSSVPVGTSLYANVTVGTNSSGEAVQVATVGAAAFPSLSPSAANIADSATTLTINGTNFDPNPAGDTVAFNLGVTGTVTAATATQLTVTLTSTPTSLAGLTAVVSSYGISSGSPLQVATVINGTWTVTDPNGAAGSGSNADVTLPFALAALQAAQGHFTIEFANGVNSTFNLTGDTITLDSTLQITADVTVIGLGATNLTVSGNNAVQDFNITSGLTASISGLTIANGSGVSGGGIVNAGTLTLSNDIVSGNAATAYGGGIYNAGTLTVSDYTSSGNTASGSGSGIYNAPSGTLTISSAGLPATNISDDITSQSASGVTLNGTGTTNISGNINLGPGSLTDSSSAQDTIAGVIGQGAAGLIKNGTGTLTLTSANTYIGTSTVSNGILNLGNVAATNTGTVEVDSPGTLSFAAGITSPVLGALAGTGDIDLTTADSEAVMLNVGCNGDNTVFDGILSGLGGLTKQGAGTLSLESPNTYEGATLISAATVNEPQQNLPGPVESVGLLPVTAGLQYDLDASATGSLVTNGVDTNDGGLEVTGWNDLSGNNNYFTPAISGQDPVLVQNVFNGLPALLFDDDNVGTPMVAENANVTSQTVFIVDYILGTSGSSDGIWGTSGQDESIQVNGSSEGAAYSVPGDGNTRITEVGSFDVDTATVGPFSTANVLAATGNFAAATQIGGSFDVGYFYGYIGEVLVYNTQLNSGQRQLVETYLSDKWLGTHLNSNAPPPIQSGLPATTNVTLDSDATLDLDGGAQQVAAIAGSGSVIDSTGSNQSVLTVTGTVAPGPGVLTTGNIVLASSSSTFAVDLNGTTGTQYDQLVVNGTATLAGDLSIDLGSSFTPQIGETFDIIQTTDGVSGTFNQGNTITCNGYTFAITYDNNDVVLTVVSPTTTNLTGNGPSTSTYGDAVTFTVTVSGGSAINGETVTIEDANNANAVVASPTLTNGVVTFDIANLTVGTHDLFAVYNGDRTHAGSNDSTTPVTQFTYLATPIVSVSAANITYGDPLLDAGISATATGLGDATAIGAIPGALVPAYFYPSPGGSPWDQLTAAAAAGAPIMAIMNPDSGPGLTADPNYVSAVNALRTAGGKVLGYVATEYATMTLAYVEAEIDDYRSLYNVDGIFVDEMTSDTSAADLQYYQAIDDYVHAEQPGWIVVGGAGTSTPPAYTQVADVLVEFENDTSAYGDSYTPPSWETNYPASRIANIVYNVASAATMESYVAQAESQHAGWLYVTDDTQPNPYGALPSYWNDFLAAEASSGDSAGSGGETISGNFSFTYTDSDGNTSSTAPSAAGTYTVTATFTSTDPNYASGASGTATFSIAPTVTGISPASGPSTGGTAVVITGTGFTGATAVNFGGSSATTFTVNSSTQITATDPAGSVGVVDVTVVTAGATSATSAADQFTFTPSIIVTSKKVNGDLLNVTSSITSVSETGDSVQVTTSAADGFYVGELVAISGVATTGFNGTYTVVSVIDSTDFTYTDPTANLGISNGGSAVNALGGSQRSMVDSITYQFNQTVTLGAGAITMDVNSGYTGTAGSVPDTISYNTIDDGHTWLVTFGGANVIGNSIADGVFDITLNASAVTADVGSATLAASQTDTFFRLFGDSNGDAQVSGRPDVQNFAAAFGTSNTSSAYLAYFDYNADGSITGRPDVQNFAARFGTSLSGFTPTI